MDYGVAQSNCRSGVAEIAARARPSLLATAEIYKGDAASFLRDAALIASAIPYAAASIGHSSETPVEVSLLSCCLISSHQFGRFVLSTQQFVEIEFQYLGHQQRSRITNRELPAYVARNGFEVVTMLPSGPYRVVHLRAP